MNIVGTAADDRLSGTDAGNDTLSGFGGNDALSGAGGNDVLVGGAGNDTLRGGAGADIYVFNRGWGRDTVYNADTDALGVNRDKILFGTGILPADIAATRSGSDLILTLAGASDRIAVSGYFDADGAGSAAVDTIAFADGTVWNVAAVKARVLANTPGDDSITGYAGADSLYGLDGNDTIRGGDGKDTLLGGNGNDKLYGDDGDDLLSGGSGIDIMDGGLGNDRFDGGAGDDLLIGGAGADTYLFGKGAGEDTIDNIDSDGPGKNADRILLGAGIGPADVTLTRGNTEGFNTSLLVLTINATGERLRVVNYFDDAGLGQGAVDTIEFADGTVWNTATVMSKVLAATAGNDHIVGYAGNDRLVGEDGNDWIRAGAGNDTLYGGTGADQLSGADGNDVAFGEAGNDKLMGGNGSDFLYGGAGDDVLNGDAGADRLDGGAGTDLLIGGLGADTYVFGKGSGQDTIRNLDNDKQGTETDRILLGAGIGAADVTVVRSSSDLILKIDGTDDQLTVEGYFNGDALLGSAVDIIEFADGTRWNVATVKAKAPTGTAGDDVIVGGARADYLAGFAGNDTIRGEQGGDTLAGGDGADSVYGGDGNDNVAGENGNDVLDGGSGNDVLSGGNGNDTLEGGAGDDRLTGGAGNDVMRGGAGADTYSFGKGSGRDTIDNNDADLPGTYGDKVLLGAGIATSDVTLQKSGNDLLLTIRGTNDELQILDYFDASIAEAAVETIQFADGTVWNMDAVKAQALLGTERDEAIVGYAGADRLNGGAGHDNLWGRDGNDVLLGGVGNDRLYGENGDDALKGEDGDDDLDGAAGDDRLEGGAGNDVLRGGEGADTYVFGKGSGRDTVVNGFFDIPERSADTIQLGAGIGAADLTLLRSGYDLILKLNVSDQLTVKNYFLEEYGNGDKTLETVRFADGSSLDTAAIKARSILQPAQSLNVSGSDGNDTLEGKAGNDELFGNGGDDLIDGGEGDDYMSGGFGSDTYVFGIGSGKDTISSFDWHAGKVDTVQLGDGVLPAHLTFQRHGDDLLVMIAGTPDTLRIASHFVVDVSGYQIDRFRFADGTILDPRTIKLGAPGGTGMSDHLRGTANADTLDGLAGDDTLFGGGGNDVVDGGDGDDNLFAEDGDDLLRGGAHNDLLGGGNGNDTLYGQDGSDKLVGGAGNDRLDGGIGNDVLDGESGEDAYVFGIGSGNDVAAAGIGDVVQLASGVLTTNLMLERSGADLVLSIAGRNDTLALTGYFIVDGTADEPKAVQLKFADGTSWGLAAVRDKLLAATAGDDVRHGFAQADSLSGLAGNDILYGEAGDDLLDGGAGNDRLIGGAGNDTYLFGLGSGKDVVNAHDGGAAGVDVIRMGAGVLARNTIAARDGGDLVLRIAGAGDELRVSGYFSDMTGTGYRVGEVRFADGTVWNTATLKVKVLAGTAEDDALTGYAGAETLRGLSGDDLLDGKAGNDSLDGGNGDDALYGGDGSDRLQGEQGNDRLFGQGGNDRLDGGAGNDLLSGDAGNDTYVFGLGSGTDTIDSFDTGAGKLDVVELGAGVLAANVAVARVGLDLVLRIGGTADELTIASFFRDDTTGYQVEQVRFADGTAWNVATLKAKVLAGTAEDDSLTGYATPDTMAGYAGSDSLFGFGGNDRLDGGSGNDRLVGGAGNDTYVVGDAGDVVTELQGEGTDTVLSSIAYTLGLSVENLTLFGAAAIDGTGNDLNNRIAGNGGANRLTGGLGTDVLTGAGGNDVFVFATPQQSSPAARDTITDFVGGQDRIDLTAIDANSATTANDAFTGFVAGTAAFTQAGQLRFSNGVLFGNTDADQDTEFAITLTGVGALGTADILL